MSAGHAWTSSCSVMRTHWCSSGCTQTGSGKARGEMNEGICSAGVPSSKHTLPSERRYTYSHARKAPQHICSFTPAATFAVQLSSWLHRFSRVPLKDGSMRTAHLQFVKNRHTRGPHHRRHCDGQSHSHTHEGVSKRSANLAHSCHTVRVVLTFSYLVQVMSPKLATVAHTHGQTQRVLAGKNLSQAMSYVSATDLVSINEGGIDISILYVHFIDFGGKCKPNET